MVVLLRSTHKLPYILSHLSALKDLVILFAEFLGYIVKWQTTASLRLKKRLRYNSCTQKAFAIFCYRTGLTGMASALFHGQGRNL